MSLHLAVHSDPDAYWSGGDYELNISFDTLRDKQWQHVIEEIWKHEALAGPFSERYIPRSDPQIVDIQIPQPTAAQTQYGALLVDSLWVGCRLLATRSLFECVTLEVPLGMFTQAAKTSILPLDQVYQSIALAIFDRVPFDIANIGFQSECKLVTELLANPRQRDALFAAGDFYARDEILILLNVDPSPYPAARPGLRWISA